MKKRKKKMHKAAYILLASLIGSLALAALSVWSGHHGDECHYREVQYRTPNFDENKVNEVKGVILHHTAEPTVHTPTTRKEMKSGIRTTSELSPGTA